MKLTEAEQKVMQEELGTWINSDCSPYEEDLWARRLLADEKSRAEQSPSPDTRQRSDTVTRADSCEERGTKSETSER